MPSWTISDLSQHVNVMRTFIFFGISSMYCSRTFKTSQCSLAHPSFFVLAVEADLKYFNSVSSFELVTHETNHFLPTEPELAAAVDEMDLWFGTTESEAEVPFRLE